MVHCQELDQQLKSESDEEEFSSPVKKFDNATRRKRIVISDDVEPVNRFFLCVNLGWLFENPLFPRELFVERPPEMKIFASRPRTALDQLPVLRQSLVYAVCPYLNELKVVLSQFHSGYKVSHQNQN